MTEPTGQDDSVLEHIAYEIHDDVVMALGYPLGPKAEDALIDSVKRHLAAARSHTRLLMAELEATKQTLQESRERGDKLEEYLDRETRDLADARRVLELARKGVE